LTPLSSLGATSRYIPYPSFPYPGENPSPSDWAAAALWRRSPPWRRCLGYVEGGRCQCAVWSAYSGSYRGATVAWIFLPCLRW
jgi:hypothetical protein